MATKEECFREMSGTIVRWKINNFSNLSQANGECIESPTFWVSDSRWQILFYPKGIEDDDKDYVSLYLKKREGRSPFLASANFSIYGKDFLMKTRNIKDSFEESVCGLSKFIKTTKLLSELTMRDLNDTFTIECSVWDLENLSKESTFDESSLNDTVLNDCSIFGNKNLLKQCTSTQTLKLDDGVQALTKNLQDILLRSDVTIKIQQKEFQAHRAILAARSPVFASMFQNEMKEHLNCIKDITDCDAGSFQLFLLFIYTGKLDKTTNENSINLYRTADKYGVIDLRQMCRDLMLESLEIESVCDVIDLAMTYEELDLLKKAIEFFTVNAAKMFHTQQWQDLLHQKPSVASSVLKQMSEVGQISIIK